MTASVFGYPVAQAAPVALRAIMDFLAAHERPRQVRMVFFNEVAAAVYRQTWNQWYAGEKSERL